MQCLSKEDPFAQKHIIKQCISLFIAHIATDLILCKIGHTDILGPGNSHKQA